jgi:hypothetical protein
MIEPLRILLNAIFFDSPYIFEDGSRISYHAQFDILRYENRNSGISKILDIGLTYDADSQRLRIESSGNWRWRSVNVPLNTADTSGAMLTADEKQDVLKKLHIFQRKHPKKFEPLKA